MEPEKLLHFPTIFCHSSCIKQDNTPTREFSDLNNTMLANPTFVLQGFEYAVAMAVASD